MELLTSSLFNKKKRRKKKILNATSRASLVSEKKNLERVSNFLGNCNTVVYLLFTRIGRYISEELLERQPVRCFARKIRSGIYRHEARSNGESFKMVDAGNLFAPHVAPPWAAIRKRVSTRSRNMDEPSLFSLSPSFSLPMDTPELCFRV